MKSLKEYLLGFLILLTHITFAQATPQQVMSKEDIRMYL